MKKTLFMIHGMFCGAWCWENYKGFFEDKGYECVTTTLRHHDLGLDELPDARLGTTSLLDYAKDLEDEILDATNIEAISKEDFGAVSELASDEDIPAKEAKANVIYLLHKISLREKPTRAEKG